jgi:hypothetical protein
MVQCRLMFKILVMNLLKAFSQLHVLHIDRLFDAPDSKLRPQLSIQASFNEAHRRIIFLFNASKVIFLKLVLGWQPHRAFLRHFSKTSSLGRADEVALIFALFDLTDDVSQTEVFARGDSLFVRSPKPLIQKVDPQSIHRGVCLPTLRSDAAFIEAHDCVGDGCITDLSVLWVIRFDQLRPIRSGN